MKKRCLTALYVVIFISLAILSNVNFKEIFSLPNNFSASYTDIDSVNQNAILGGFVKANLEKGQTSVDSNGESEGVIIFKLFDLIPIRKVNVKILPEEEVYVGGTPIGLNISSNGAVVVSDTMVASHNGKLETHKNKLFKTGDIITKINDKHVSGIGDIKNALEGLEGEEINVEYLRKNELCKSKTKLIKNDEGEYKLGLWVQDDVSGIGTLTYVDKDSKNYAALGHAVTDGSGGNIIPITDGKLYKCSLLGVTKGERNKPGELRCLFMQSDETGDVKQNTKFGIFGHLDDTEGLVDENLTAKIGGRLSVTPGAAKIVSSVSGIRTEYDIEIIKASYQAKQSDKSIVFRVKDKRLLELTGGIVQGMSGSPILQNGKIVGAVTHVFLNDPTKGYGVYTDWMLKQAE